MAQPPVAADDDKYFDLLCHAAKRGRLEQLKTLLSQYSVRTHYSKRDESGQAPIHYASTAGHVDCIKLLLAKDSDLINVRTKKDGMTALHLAAKKGQEATVALLLDSGSEVDVRDKEKNQTPLHLACYYGHEAVVKLLLSRGAKSGEKMSTGETPLERASLKGHQNIVALFSDTTQRSSQRRLLTPVTPLAKEATCVVSLAPDPLAWLRGSFHTLVQAFYIIEADFEFFESDGDGCITLSELVTGFQQMPGNIPHKFVIALFSEVDKESKGYIGEADFCSLLFLWIRSRNVNHKLVEHHNAEEAKILSDALSLMDKLYAQYADGNATHMKRERVRDLLFALEDAPAKARLEAEMQALNLPALLPVQALPGLLYSCGLPEEIFLQLTWAQCTGVPKFPERLHRFLSTVSFPGLQSVIMELLGVKSTRLFALNFVPLSGPTQLLDSEDALSVAIATVINSPDKLLRVLVVEPGTGTKSAPPSAAMARRKKSKEKLFATPMKKPSTPSVAKLEITVQQLSRKDRQKYEWEVNYSEIQFLSRVGAGGYGEVWLANWRGRHVAAKTIKPAAGDNPQLLASFLHEIGLLTQLKHPNIVQFEAACLQLETICYLTEYMANGSLYTFLRRGAIEPPIRLRMALSGAKGMQFLHGCTPPLIHRDLKSHNLLVDPAFQLKVCDFGISKILEHDETTNTKLGTLSWMAPEALLDSKYTKESDVYSYGMVLWEIVSGQQPFQELQAPIKIMGRIIEGDRPAMPPNVDPGYAALVRKCWDWQPAARPSFDYVVQQLEKLPAAITKP